MAFDGFYIKLSSIAKLPHTDTYYACFEYKNKYKDKFNITDTLASSCIVNFNNSIFASKTKAFKQLINFYTEKLAFTLQMGFDGFSYLIAAENILIHAAHHLTGMKRQSVEEMHGVGQSVYTFHFKVIGIFLQTAALLFEVEALIHQANGLACATGCLDIEAQSSLWIAFTNDDFI